MNKDNEKGQEGHENQQHDLSSTQSEKNQSACTPNDKDEKVTAQIQELLTVKNTLLASSLGLLYVAIEVDSWGSVIAILFAYAIQYAVVTSVIFIILCHKKLEKGSDRTINRMEVASFGALYIAVIFLIVDIIIKWCNL